MCYFFITVVWIIPFFIYNLYWLVLFKNRNFLLSHIDNYNNYCLFCSCRDLKNFIWIYPQAIATPLYLPFVIYNLFNVDWPIGIHEVVNSLIGDVDEYLSF